MRCATSGAFNPSTKQGPDNAERNAECHHPAWPWRTSHNPINDGTDNARDYVKASILLAPLGTTMSSQVRSRDNFSCGWTCSFFCSFSFDLYVEKIPSITLF